MSLRLQPQVGPVMPWPNRSEGSAPIGHALVRLRLAGGAAGGPAWLLSLQKAGLLLAEEHWAQAATLLLTIEAPRGPGLGQASVDYWLGLALSKADPGSEEAILALERAAATLGARLYSHDGPLVAPRARVRLLAAGR